MARWSLDYLLSPWDGWLVLLEQEGDSGGSRHLVMESKFSTLIIVSVGVPVHRALGRF